MKLRSGRIINNKHCESKSVVGSDIKNNLLDNYMTMFTSYINHFSNDLNKTCDLDKKLELMANLVYVMKYFTRLTNK